MAERAASTAATRDDQNCKGEATTEEFIQQPGEVIAPEVPDGSVEKIAEERYGLKVTRCKQLNGYDDKNYLIHVTPTSSNPHLTPVRPEGYVMKVINTLDTRRPSILYAQIEFMRHLRSKGIPTQEPVPSLEGENVIFCQFSASEGKVKTHAVCLRTFLPGSILYDVTLTPDLCFKVGQFVASMTKALQDFQHPFYDTFECLWSLNNIPKVSEFVHVITDIRDRRMVDDVIEHFRTEVLPRRSEIRKGFIHGDPNEQNILVQRKSSQSPTSTSGKDGSEESRTGSDAGGGTGNDVVEEDKEYVVAGILDFQDAALTHPLYDLAMALGYIMLQATTFDPLEVGGHVLAGYATRLELPEVERRLLRTCVAGRLMQSLVLGQYSYTQDPGNEYLLVTAQRGWHVLHALWDTPADAVQEMWDRIQRSYGDDKK
ncbi:hydroxylysine kinase-like [Babylonia areolata]|uniref:hydroxylysine kinase-like n=1 Tax=Babylonia areolata TaxID=304850 RepID=UPI003FD41B27